MASRRMSTMSKKHAHLFGLDSSTDPLSGGLAGTNAADDPLSSKTPSRPQTPTSPNGLHLIPSQSTPVTPTTSARSSRSASPLFTTPQPSSTPSTAPSSRPLSLASSKLFGSGNKEDDIFTQARKDAVRSRQSFTGFEKEGPLGSLGSLGSLGALDEANDDETAPDSVPRPPSPEVVLPAPRLRASPSPMPELEKVSSSAPVSTRAPIVAPAKKTTPPSTAFTPSTKPPPFVTPSPLITPSEWSGSFPVTTSPTASQSSTPPVSVTPNEWSNVKNTPPSTPRLSPPPMMAPNAWFESSLLLPDSTSSQLAFSAISQVSVPILPSLRHSPSLDIFERNIEHVGPTENLSPHEALDLGIPSVLDDAAEAFVNDKIDISVSSTVFIPPSPSMTNLSALNISSMAITPQPMPSPIINNEELEIAQHNPWDISFSRNAPVPAPASASAAAAVITTTTPAPRSNTSPLTAINFNPLAMLLPTPPASSRTLPLPEPPTASMSAPAANGRSTRVEFSDLMQSWNSRTAAQGTMAISPLSGADREGIPAEGLGMGFGVVLDSDDDKYIQKKTLAETLSTTSARDFRVFENPWN